MTCHRGVAKPEQLDDILNAAIESDGVSAAITKYRDLRDEHYGAGSFDFSAGTLNGLAENLARAKGDMDGAIEVVKRNIEMNPDDVYSHMMLGQLHLQKGDKSAALGSIQRAIELDPENQHAKRMLAQINTAE